jgi:hypothetical protein
MLLIQEKSLEYDPDRKVAHLYPVESIHHLTEIPQLSLILEYVPGRITDTLDRLIALYRPDSVVVGTRGRRTWQGMSMSIVGSGIGSVSKYAFFVFVFFQPCVYLILSFCIGTVLAIPLFPS